MIRQELWTVLDLLECLAESWEDKGKTWDTLARTRVVSMGTRWYIAYLPWRNTSKGKQRSSGWLERSLCTMQGKREDAGCHCRGEHHCVPVGACSSVKSKDPKVEVTRARNLNTSGAGAETGPRGLWRVSNGFRESRGRKERGWSITKVLLIVGGPARILSPTQTKNKIKDSQRASNNKSH